MVLRTPRRRCTWRTAVAIAVLSLAIAPWLAGQETTSSIVGLTEDQVQTLFGSASLQQRAPDGTVLWFYDGTSQGTVTLYFVNGKVARTHVSGKAVQPLWPEVIQELQDKKRAKNLPPEARRHVGGVATLCGTVGSLSCDKQTRAAFLMFNEPSGSVGVEIPAALREEYGYLSGRFCAAGTVKEQSGKYWVTISRAGDLKGEEGWFGAGVRSACDEGVELPALQRQVEPRYPRKAVQAKIEGTVLLAAVVRADGTVGDVRVLRSLNRQFGLDQEAIRAVQAWRFKPGTQAGVPVPVLVTVEVSFKVAGRR
jgi:TonB family protein